MENVIFTLEITLKGNVFILMPLCILFLGIGLVVWVRERDISVFRVAMVICGITAFCALANFVVLNLVRWHSEMITILQATKEDGVSVPTSDLISPVMLQFSSFWWIPVLLALFFIFMPIGGYHRKSKQSARAK
ncbi:hypothetical protein [Agrobacterium tumefaciens]|uniref:hypothetical protein n=1 Tax=Agrobacterium tumefaciens TaxID=358 RepID=UPI00157441BB|nr:hypothetical protein [Agrobacterium tumefaciens]WCK69312.1 hypothetical protein G6L23_026565 [Agrobacterium tumefaciens]